MTQSWVRRTVLTTLAFCAGCGSVDSAENLGDPIVTVIARLESAPAQMPADNLRATLVWLNGPPFATGRCDEGECGATGRDYTVLTMSDIEVDTEFPLTVRLGVFELPNPIPGEYPGSVSSEGEPIKLTYNSLPEAEVVLYEDGNQNHKLDLLAPGQPGPGPDRIVALSSGRDEGGMVTRSVIVNKRSPIPAGFANNADAPALDIFAFPLPKELTDLGVPNSADALFAPPGTPVPQVYPDGVYALRLSAPPTEDVVQHALLSTHNLVAEPITNDAALLSRATKTVEPIADTVVQLFPVTPDRKSWLARGCNPFNEYTNKHLSPPPGSEVQCGAGALRYSSNPGDYCGWTRVIDYSQTGEPFEAPAWWPCDSTGLKANQPYTAPARAIEDDVRTNASNLIDARASMSLDLDCSDGRIQHFDAVPGLRVPNAAPPAGSQVMCYGADALSFIAPRADGCRIKYTFELASDAHVAPEFAWDLRASRPAWWPCDAQGQLMGDRGYVGASTQPAAACRTLERPEMASRALPTHARVRCESATEISYAPLWSDGCEPLRFATVYSDPIYTWEGDAPAWWPCDDKGNFIAGKGYMPW